MQNDSFEWLMIYTELLYNKYVSNLFNCRPDRTFLLSLFEPFAAFLSNHKSPVSP